jgi:glycine cleavage system H protein
MSYPSEYRYTKDHEWADAQNGVITVGITHHAQDALGDIVFVELPKVGRTLKQGETFGVVESIKAVSDLYSPLTGEVIEINSALPGEPGKLNTEPHKGAWLMKLKASNPAEFEALLDSTTYTKHVESLK